MSARDIAEMLPDLHMLTVIAETRSLTQTARRLGIAKSSVSMRLKDLERALDLPLVRRVFLARGCFSDQGSSGRTIAVSWQRSIASF